MKKNRHLAKLFDHHVGKFCMELINANYDSIIHDPFFANMSLLIKDNADSHLSDLLSKYMVIENPGDISIMMEIGYYDIAFEGEPPEDKERTLHIIHLDYLYRDEPIQPDIGCAQSSIYHEHDDDERPEIYILDVLKECISQHTARPTLYIEDYC